MGIFSRSNGVIGMTGDISPMGSWTNDIPMPSTTGCSYDDPVVYTAWRDFYMEHEYYARKVILIELLIDNYYKLSLNDGGVIFVDRQEGTYRVLTPEDARFADEKQCMREFSIRLKRMMRAKRIDQNRLSEITGLSQGSISGYYAGKRWPSSYSIKIIADALECSIDFLLKF